MYPRHHSMSQQQLGIPVHPEVTSSNNRESPLLVFPGYRPPANQATHHQPKYLQKTSSLPLQPPPPAATSPRLYYYYGGSNRSSTIDSQTGLDNQLNLSQDSGLSPSPLEQHHSNVIHHYPASQQTGVYDNYRRNIAQTPEPQNNRNSAIESTKSGRWPFADFFRRKSVTKEVVEVDNPPPLPPKKRTNVFQPTMAVRPGNVRQERPASVPGFGSGRSWKHERETAMMRVEAQRNSLVLSSDEENEQQNFRREVASAAHQGSVLQRTQVTNEMLQGNYNRMSVTDLCHIPEMGEPFPSELDFSQITKQTDYDPRVPPPPPPRDPRRKSYLLQGHSPQARPVSYSFENLPVHRLFRSPVPEPSDLGLPLPGSIPVPMAPSRGINKNFSNSEQQLSLRLSGAEVGQQQQIYSSHSPSPAVVAYNERSRFEGQPPRSGGRGPRSASLSNCNRVAVPYSSPSPTTANNNLVNAQYTSGAESPLQLYKRSQLEYWKSPPPPFVPCPEPSYFAECLQNGGPPMRPKQRWRNHSAEDSILLLQGKSSPSSGSLTSRDSGCSEPFIPPNQQQKQQPQQQQQQQQTAISASTEQASLPVVVEKSESVERDMVSDIDDGDCTDSVVDAVRLSSVAPSSPRSSVSPVRTSTDQPGFSCRKRRSLFRDAMSELEDAIKVIQSDTDLLDRAERRDLPTAHQELIVRARIEEALSKKKQQVNGDETATTSLNTSAEMAFSDMDNFMNWNTSSSFENLEERGLTPATSTPLRQRTPSRRRSAVADKKEDDMVYRICKANNRPRPSRSNPAVIAGQSYLLLSPDAAKTLLGVSQKKNQFESDEPDIVTDDVHYRSIRDALLLPKVLESQPKFGIPQGPVSGCGNDYLHSVPSGKYKSTFHAMKNPDTFLDDLAVRNLRKDDSRNTPDLLGIYKDPNVTSSSCWQHKLEERLFRRPSSPLVFYPNKNNQLMQALSQKISQTIRKQSGCPVGGTEEQIVTYDDLLRNKELMREMKEALLECTDEDLNNDGSKPDWAGKTIYELLCGNIDELRERSKSRSESRTRSSDCYESAPESNGDVIVGHCLLEHDLTSFSKQDDEAKIVNGGRQITSILEDGSTSSLRALERGDSGEEEQLLSMQLETSGKDNTNPEREVRKRDTPQTVVGHQDKESTTSSASQVPLSPEGGESQMGIASSELSSKVQLSQDGDRKATTADAVESRSSKPRRSHHERSLRRRAARRHTGQDNDNSLEDVTTMSYSNNSMETSSGVGGMSTASERRMAKYKEERRRQLASQIASRLSNACSSSSSDEQEEDNHRVVASGGESAGSGGGNGHAKYRRHRSKRTGEKDGSLALPGGSPSDKSGIKLVRRRRRRSLNGGTSPAPVIRTVDKIPVVERLSAFLGDADGEDEGLDREDSPEHIYQRIDEDEDDVTGDKVYRAVPASSMCGDSKWTNFASDRKFQTELTSAEVGGARAYVTTHQPTRGVPRKYSLPKESKSENPVSGSQVSSTSSDRSPTSYLQQQQQPQQQQHSERLRSTRESTSPRTGSSQEKDQQQQQSVPPKKSALNTSYSSEELLFQAASSLQGLEEEFNSIHHSRHRPPSGSHGVQPAAPSGNSLSSPEMIKCLSRTLTPPVSPFHHQLRASGANGERKSPSAVPPPPQPDSEASSTVSSCGTTSVPISDPLIDANWPGRPKRNGLSEQQQLPRMRRASPVSASTSTRPRSRGSSDTDLSINVSAASEAFQGPGSGNSSTPSTSGKPPIFPSPERGTPNLAAANRSSTHELFQTYRPNEDIPAFVREFAARRRTNATAASATFNPNEPAPPPPTPTKRTKATNALAARPHSAFIPRTQGSHKKTSFELEPEVESRSGPVPAARRRSDFLTRYENLMQRAQAAMKAVDSLDFETLSRREEGNSDDDDNDDNECVDFNEEEVLQRCQDFLKDYDKSKQRRSLDAGVAASPPVPKPRQFVASGNTSSAVADLLSTESPKPSLRTRSSSLTIHDKRSGPEDVVQAESNATDDRVVVGHRTVLPKPILKKSSEDLKPVPILKNRVDTDSAQATASSSTSSSSGSGSVAGGILKRKSVTDSGNETTASRPDHVRIRSPSPDLYGSDDEDGHQMSRRPILRSRKSSIGEDRASSPEFLQSILKRRSSQEDLDDGSAATSGATSRSSPEPPHSILKRKLSVGSLGSHSPEGSLVGGSSFSSILRKKSHSQHSSCQGSLEDLSCEGEKIRSILKKRSTVSTDDELVETFHDRPKSILKGRRSEESLSPLSDPCDLSSGARLFRDPDNPSAIRPILKQRDSREEFSPVHETSSASREKSASPSRGAAVSPPEPTEVTFSGSTGLSTPLRRASLPVSPRRTRASFATTNHNNSESDKVKNSGTDNEEVSGGSTRRASFVSKATVFIDSSSNETWSPQRTSSSRHSPEAATSGQQPEYRAEEAESSSEERECPSPVGGGILRRQGSTNSRGSNKEESTVSDAETSSTNVVKKRSILKHDSLELISDVGRLRGVLKKDSSYDETCRRPILKNNFDDSEDNKSQRSKAADSSSSNTSSSEDLESLLGANRAFSGVVIDPVPAGVRKSSTFDDHSGDRNDNRNSDSSENEDQHHHQQQHQHQEATPARRTSPVKSRKSSLVHPRQPVIPPSSVKISADGNLADQLECLADRAEAELKKQMMNQQEEIARKSEVEDLPLSTKSLNVVTSEKRILEHPPPKHDAQNKITRAQSCRIGTNSEKDKLNNKQTLSAQDYYAIYRNSKESGNGKKVERKGSFSSSASTSPKENRPENSQGLNRSKSFSAYSLQNRNKNQAADDLNRRGKEEDQADNSVKEDNKMLEQNNKRPPEIKVTGGIAERLAALQRSGEEDWKKKIPRQKKEDPVIEVLVGSNKQVVKNENGNDNEVNENNKNSERSNGNGDEEIPTLRRGRGIANRIATTLDGSVGVGARPVSLVERLNQLQTAQSTWQSKVGEKDAEKYTVAGKMQKISRGNEMPPRPSSMLVTPTTATPSSSHVPRSVARSSATPTSVSNNGSDAFSDRVKKTPRPRRFQGSPPAPGGSFEDNDDVTAETTHRTCTTSSTSNDEGIDKFFAASKRDEKLDCSVGDFDILLAESEEVPALVHVKKAGPRLLNRRQRGAKNPIKHLSARTDLRQPEFDEVFEEEIQKEELIKPTPKARDSVHSHLAAEALAGLAAKEDFSNVQLKKNNTTIPHQDMVPHKTDCMLLQVKGRRICQTRLVNPTASSINSGDAYVLVTPKEIFNWIGQFSNVIERARSAEVALTILQKKDLGCKLVRRVVTLEEEKVTPNNSSNKQFWQFLGCSLPLSKVNPPGPPEEDEEYEISINELNLVWSVDLKTNELIPDESFWGCAPKFELLEDTSRVLVFDFGSEVYVWNGKSAPFETRRLGIKLAKDLWEKGLEGTAPVEGHPLIPDGKIKRPDWAILGKVNQNMETILFREKFLNWPDKSRLIKPCKENVGKKKSVAATSSSEEFVVKLSTDVERNFDISEMVSWKLEEPNLELEMTFLGRGRSYYDEAERRQYEIETLSTKVWHVSEYDTIEMDPKEFNAQFFFEDTYVVRWKYKVSLTGRDLKGRPSKHVAVGRERWAYFFWQGSQSGVTEKGASALMTVELDRERGPQIRVVQGREPAAFLNLWSGRMVVHLGRRGGDSKAGFKQPRLYVVRGEVPEEAHCVEVECKAENLRSRGCFLFIDRSDTIRIWIGSGSPDHTRAIAKLAAENYKSLVNAKSYNIVEETEGQESEVLKKFIGSRTDYVTLLPVLPDSNPTRSTRLYFMSSVSGDFQVKEVSCPFLSQDVPNLMPFNQSDLYSVEQPALFLIDAGGECLWFWQGWWPDVGHDAGDTNLSTGSGLIRWHAERRVAMQTTLEYRNAKYSAGSKSPPMKLIWAGHEPKEFTNLFPAWVKKSDVHQLNQKFLDDPDLEHVLAALSKSTYTWEELQQRPLPDGVDPSRLEKYLSDEDFKTHLGLSREDFCAAPRWKQLEIRKEKGFF